MKNLLFRGPIAVLAALALLAPASADALTVKIRVEGATQTLLPATTVTIPDSGDINDGVSTDCEWNEPAGALHAGTSGNWDRSSFVQTILGEYHGSSNSSGWYEWVNGKYGYGACYENIAEGDEILFTAGGYDAGYNPNDLPIYVRDVPARVTPGSPFTVTVQRSVPSTGPFGYESGTGTMQPATGATVTAGDASATVGSDGKATLTVSQRGALSVQARRGSGAERSEPVTTCATDGADGYCGTQTPQGQTVEPAPQPSSPPCATSGRDGRCGSVDRTAPFAAIDGIADGDVFAKGKGPRELKGHVDEVSPLLMVKLRLTRQVGGRCWTWSASKERFVNRPCGVENGWFFKIGDRADWSYLLPKRLPRGRYVLDVNAIDRAYNRDDDRRRGTNRVVFVVR